MLNDEGRMQNGEADEPQVTAAATIEYASPQKQENRAWLGMASCWCFNLTAICVVILALVESVFMSELGLVGGMALGLLTAFIAVSLPAVGVILAIYGIRRSRKIGFAIVGLFLNPIPLLLVFWLVSNRF